jgi:hypothetical protein
MPFKKKNRCLLGELYANQLWRQNAELIMLKQLVLYHCALIVKKTVRHSHSGSAQSDICMWVTCQWKLCDRSLSAGIQRQKTQYNKRQTKIIILCQVSISVLVYRVIHKFCVRNQSDIMCRPTAERETEVSVGH